MDVVIAKIDNLLPGITFIAGDSLYWSPKTKTITYRDNDISEENVWGLLHEAGHALLEHHSYISDMELVKLEAEAWQAANRLGKQIGHLINPEHIQECLDTYRDWLHQRSTCPRCGVVSFQESTSLYRCYNCHKEWTVSTSRFCRPYRLGAIKNKNRSENIPQAIFQVRNPIK